MGLVLHHPKKGDFVAKKITSDSLCALVYVDQPQDAKIFKDRDAISLFL